MTSECMLASGLPAPVHHCSPVMHCRMNVLHWVLMVSGALQALCQQSCETDNWSPQCHKQAHQAPFPTAAATLHALE